jgi:hypothetical protein
VQSTGINNAIGAVRNLVGRIFKMPYREKLIRAETIAEEAEEVKKFKIPLTGDVHISLAHIFIKSQLTTRSKKYEVLRQQILKS